MSLPSGARLGRYEIRSPLGEGGMGEVYVAFDNELEREVAVKVLRGEQDDSTDRIRRFVQEAKAASALNHPNVATVYEIGRTDELRYIAMEVVEGETLRARLARGEMPIDDVLSIGSQVAAALAAAHKAGIIHRDVKPENVIVRPDGYAKVLDFGLAKLSQARAADAETLMTTNPGVVMGTLRYMAPEQLGGSDVTSAADVFSLGVMLYEMVSGTRPFEGTTPTEIATAILTKNPAPLGTMRPATPPRLAAVIAKALAKNPDQRYPTAAEMLEELKQISRENASGIGLEQLRLTRSKGMRTAGIAVAALIVLAGIAALVLQNRKAQRVERAQASIAEAERLFKARSYAEALDLARAAEEVLPADHRVLELIARTSIPATITSEPPGAAVFLERFKGKAGRVRVGETPLEIKRLARADYVVTLEKNGFAPAVRPLTAAPAFLRNLEMMAAPANLKVKLHAAAAGTPPEMVFVEGGPYRLAGWSRPTDRVVKLSDFLIDRYEVSNAEFERFIRDGGYRRRELWRHPFIADGKTLSFEEAMARFHDTNGLPGPRNWVAGAPPAGRETHPVSGVTWHEAAAFAHWKGKSLPTVYQWERAARPPMNGAVGTNMPWGIVHEGVDATERANFRGKGTMPVDSLPFGIGPFGAHHMAGNVAEWNLNTIGENVVVRGGAWDDAIYTFGRFGSRPPFYASDTVGFRCVKELQPGTDQGSFALNPVIEIPQYHPVSDAQFAEIRRRYDYVQTPLDARVVETTETADWRRQKIVYTVDGKSVPAYLYLPKGYTKPQVIHFSPAGDVVGGFRPLPASIETSLAPFIRGGRAVFSVVQEGFSERPRDASFQEPDSRTVEYADFVADQVTELRRGLDYLQTRQDLDSSRIAFMGPSAGSWAGLILTAVESRYRSVLFIGTHIRPSEISDAPAANRINFAPRIAPPKMMYQGRYDESAPLDTAAMPLFRLLPEPKRLEVYEGSHVPPMDIAVPTITRWFDETMGRVGG